MCLLGPRYSSSHWNSFFMLFIFSTFLLCSFYSHILLQSCFDSFVSSCWFVLVHLPLTFWYNFWSLFLKVLFGLYCLTLFQSLWSLLSCVTIFLFVLFLQVAFLDRLAVLLGYFHSCCLWCFWSLLVFFDHFYVVNRCIDASPLSSMLVNLLPPSFLDTYNLSISSVGCKA